MFTNKCSMCVGICKLAGSKSGNCSGAQSEPGLPWQALCSVTAYTVRASVSGLA